MAWCIPFSKFNFLWLFYDFLWLLFTIFYDFLRVKIFYHNNFAVILLYLTKFLYSIYFVILPRPNFLVGVWGFSSNSIILMGITMCGERFQTLNLGLKSQINKKIAVFEKNEKLPLLFLFDSASYHLLFWVKNSFRQILF